MARRLAVGGSAFRVPGHSESDMRIVFVVGLSPAFPGDGHEFVSEEKGRAHFAEVEHVSHRVRQDRKVDFAMSQSFDKTRRDVDELQRDTGGRLPEFGDELWRQDHGYIVGGRDHETALCRRRIEMGAQPDSFKRLACGFNGKNEVFGPLGQLHTPSDLYEQRVIEPVPNSSPTG